MHLKKEEFGVYLCNTNSDSSPGLKQPLLMWDFFTLSIALQAAIPPGCELSKQTPNSSVV